jgi:sigma-B regulation protein RsbU (phosphoserine phosphatase)
MALYTDGITEATNNTDEPFGLEGLARTLQKSTTCSAEAICDKVMRDVRDYSGPHAAQDDRTLVVLKAM